MDSASSATARAAREGQEALEAAQDTAKREREKVRELDLRSDSTYGANLSGEGDRVFDSRRKGPLVSFILGRKLTFSFAHGYPKETGSRSEFLHVSVIDEGGEASGGNP